MRDCFKPNSIVLGPIDDPLVPESECKMKNIYDDINACLCTSNLCNLANSYNNDERKPRTRISQKKYNEDNDKNLGNHNKSNGSVKHNKVLKNRDSKKKIIENATEKPETKIVERRDRIVPSK